MTVENDDQVESSSLNIDSQQQSSSKQQQQQTNGFHEDKNSKPRADNLLEGEEHAQVNGDCNINLAVNGNARESGNRRAILNGNATAINGDGISMDIGKENGTEPKIKCPDLSAIRSKSILSFYCQKPNDSQYLCCASIKQLQGFLSNVCKHIA